MVAADVDPFNHVAPVVFVVKPDDDTKKTLYGSAGFRSISAQSLAINFLFFIFIYWSLKINANTR